MNLHEIQRKAAGYATVLATAGTAWWGLSRGLPRYREVAALRAHRAAIEATTLKAREETVRSGGTGLEDSIRQARARFDAVHDLVPQVGSGESDGDVRRLIAALADRSGVALRALEDEPGGREGPLLVSSARVTATGKYHDLGGWLSMVESTRRLVQVHGLSMAVAPDSVTGAGGVAGGTGEAPGSVVLQASFRWFRQDSATADRDSTLEGRQ